MSTVTPFLTRLFDASAKSARIFRRAFEAAGGGPRSIASSWASMASPIRAQLAARAQLASRASYQTSNNPVEVMADRRASLDDQRDVRPACLKLVKEVFEQGASLPIVPFPEDATSIQDTPRLVLVLADPAVEWDRNGKIREQMAEWTLRRGSSARLYPASLIWCLRKSGRDLADRVETWLAWQRVQRDLAEGVLGHDIEAQERQEVQAQASFSLNACARETRCWQPLAS